MSSFTVTIHIPLILSQLKLINLQMDFSFHQLYLISHSSGLHPCHFEFLISSRLFESWLIIHHGAVVHDAYVWENWTTNVILIFIAISFMMCFTFVAFQPYTGSVYLQIYKYGSF